MPVWFDIVSVEVIVQTLDDNYTPPNTETSAAAAAAAANVEPNTSIEDHENIVTSYKELIRDQVSTVQSVTLKLQVVICVGHCITGSKEEISRVREIT